MVHPDPSPSVQAADADGHKGNAEPSAAVRIGDVITFANRPHWWKRLLRRFGILKPPPVVQWIVTSVQSPDWWSDDE